MTKPLNIEDRCILEDFDRNDPKNLGRPLYFNLRNHIVAVVQLICSDEIEMAFKLLDMVPAWYRENYPTQLTEIKKTLYQNLYSPMTYVNDADEAAYTYEQVVEQVRVGYCFPRLDILKQLVFKLNQDGEWPWIFELSTSHGPIPIGLKEEGYRFDFFAKNLNQGALFKVKDWMRDHWVEKPKDGQPKIFVNFESLEHAHRMEDVRDEYYKLGVSFDYIFLSVPLGCLGNGLPDWSTRRLGHIRGFTKKEFADLAVSFFPGFSWEMTVSHSLVLVGRKNVEKEAKV